MRPKILPLLLSIFLCAACSDMQISMNGRQYNVGKAFGAAQDLHAALVIPTDTEQKLGREAAANLAAKYGLYDDSDVMTYVNLVGLALARKAERRDVRYRFGILNTLDVNAYAAPGGYIFITKGMLKTLEDEAELAGVLAHEIQHVDQKQALKALRRSNLLAAGIKLLDKKDDFNIASGFIIGLMERGFDRDDELSADKGGVLLLAKAGYDPTGLPRALRQCHDNEKDQHMAPFASRHPAFKDRVDALASVRGLPDKGAVVKKRFLKNTSF